MDNPLRYFIVATLLAFAAAASAEQASVKEDAKKAGRAVGSTVREVGQAAKEVPKTVGGAVKEGVEAVKEGGREFKRSVKGEK